MMLLPILALLGVTCVQVSALVSAVPQVCQSDGGSNLFAFDGSKVKMNYPCKYFALKEQKCGDVLINLVPGNLWFRERYQLHSMWLHITDHSRRDKVWYGRTSNKLAVKAFNSKLEDDMFVQKGGTLNVEKKFVFSMGEKEPCVKVTYKDVFEIEFCAWDPLNTQDYKKSYFKFVCHEDMEDNEYPKQMCGGKNLKKAWKEHTESLGLKERFKPMSIYYTNFFTHADNITQTNQYCVDAARHLNKKYCSRGKDENKKLEHRVKVISNCAPILFNTRRAECLTAYSCSPMEAFISCIKWGCKNNFDENKVKDQDVKSPLCEQTAELIYFCPVIAGPGNLTARARATKCFTDFVPIEPFEGYGDDDMYPATDETVGPADGSR